MLRYLRGTTRDELQYRRTKGVNIQVFTNADWARSTSDRKNTSRGIFSIRSLTFYWYIRKQISVALSSEKIEYVAGSQEACEAI